MASARIRLLGGGGSGGPCKLVNNSVTGNRTRRAIVASKSTTQSASTPSTVAQWAKQAIACMFMRSPQSDDEGHGMPSSCDAISPADIAIPEAAPAPAATT